MLPATVQGPPKFDQPILQKTFIIHMAEKMEVGSPGIDKQILRRYSRFLTPEEQLYDHRTIKHWESQVEKNKALTNDFDPGLNESPVRLLGGQSHVLAKLQDLRSSLWSA